jgi:hypothetical protein
MTTQSSQTGHGYRLVLPSVSRSRHLSGCEAPTYTKKLSDAIGVAGAIGVLGPLGQGADKRGGTDV